MRSPLQRRTNMSYEQITQYYQYYQQHRATLKETCDRSAIHICRNPYLFRQYTLSEDSRSSFLLYLCENLPDIIRKYDSSRSSFATYFSRTVFYYFCTEFRKTRIEGYQEHALYPDIYYENQLTAEDTHDYTTSECTLPVTTRLKRQVLPKRYQLMLLILVLKTASFPTKTIMEQLLTLTEYNEKQITEYIRQIQILNEKRTVHHRKLLEERNYAYHAALTAQYALNRSTSNTGRYILLSNTLRFNTEKAKRRTVQLGCFNYLAPNTAIAKVLGMTSWQVSRCINSIRTGRLQRAIDQIQQSTL